MHEEEAQLAHNKNAETFKQIEVIPQKSLHFYVYLHAFKHSFR